MKFFNSIKFEISVLYTAILGLILFAFSGVLYLISNTFLRQIDQQLLVKAQAVSTTIQSYLNASNPGPDRLSQAVAKTVFIRNAGIFQKNWKISQKWIRQAQALGLSKDYINFVSESTRQGISSDNLEKKLRSHFLEDIQFPPPGQVTYRTFNFDHKNIREIGYPFRFDHNRYLIQIGMPQDPLMEQLRNWLYSIAISVPLILLLTNFVGRVLANRILKPVYEITELAQQITQHDLSARIKTPHFGREMGSLIESFNDMIARLEQSFKHIEQFSQHVAHELKTPLTIIQGEANLLLRRDRSVPEYKQALRIIMEESQRVLKTVDDLLLLTKLGYQQQEVFKFEDFDFLEFFSEIVEQNRLLASNKGVGVRMNYPTITSPVTVNGDRLHLRRLFFNILDNAVKFSPEGGCVEMVIVKENGKIISSITDSGPGIPPESLAKIFEKFYRPDNNTADGGLGLNIAYTIAKVHHGDIQVESRPGEGSTFRIILPAIQKPIGALN